MRKDSLQRLRISLVSGFLLMISFSGYPAPFWYQSRATSSTTTLDETDIDVIVAIAHDILKIPTRPVTVVQMECLPKHPKTCMFGDETLMRNETTSQSILNFRLRNQATFSLKRRVKRGNVTIIGDREFEKIRNEKRLEQEGLDGSVISMWLPGYDRQRSEAVIYYYGWWGDSDGCGYSVRLRKHGNLWQVIERRMDWIT